jgi:hypothetical protein
MYEDHEEHVSGQRARRSWPMRIKKVFFFNLFFSDAPCDPSMPCNILKCHLANIRATTASRMWNVE